MLQCPAGYRFQSLWFWIITKHKFIDFAPYVLFVTVGKSMLIENLPICATYILLFLMNFTYVFDDKKTEERANDRLYERRVSEKVG